MLAALVILVAGCAEDTASRVALPGFGQTAYRVEQGEKTVKEGCALLATTPEQHGRGLMNVRDLKGYDGMIFEFSSDTNVGFYMKDTPMPLSIAWLDGQGHYISSADMAPNREDPTYFAAAPFRYGFEVPQGRLGSLGISSDSTVVIGGDC
ncbi:MAG TPA: DUF192 domain-containing protein [Acidimicrobiales bacterium]|nr:DUF192 domain-containing protein [Acidimicrobiales bacterium]